MLVELASAMASVMMGGRVVGVVDSMGFAPSMQIHEMTSTKCRD
jgi:hypothetical protein